uniref:ribosomal protein S14 n=1 Tax=Hydnora esculenta TaxID=1851369 RepID=UPI0021140B18|nr:ribosomal protein S14 [Hydnora esculenta]USN93636.1 ribosomal protein S14 [Hydnora esculenta]
MAKKSIIRRENKKQNLEKKYYLARKFLNKKIQKEISLQEKNILYKKLEDFPRNSLHIRLRNRCLLTGRSRSCYRDFGQSRHILYEKFNLCLLPGTKKSNW